MSGGKAKLTVVAEVVGRRAEAVIDIRGLSLIFQTADTPVFALSSIDLSVARGEFVTFIGPSGCGKTTLMRVIADLERPTEGSVTVNGVSPEQARLQRAYGYVFQAPALYPWRTVIRNVTLPLEIIGLDRAERGARAVKYLDMVSLNGFERKFPWQLSGGMQQRVSIARALSFEPQLLLMDEPFGALDEMTREHMQTELLRICGETGSTVVFVTHSIPEAVYLSTRVVVMSPRPGQIKTVTDVDLGSKRDVDTREDPAFFRKVTEVREALRGMQVTDLDQAALEP
jgi:NitT/TauT family transport system ATP-binding protein